MSDLPFGGYVLLVTRRLIGLALLAAFGLTAVHTRADEAALYQERYRATSYLVQNLGEVNFEVYPLQSIARAFLNNRGEALIANRLWLPSPAYGLPAGWTDFRALGFTYAVGLSDFGQILVTKNGITYIWRSGNLQPIDDRSVGLGFLPWDLTRDGRALGLTRARPGNSASPFDDYFSPAIYAGGKLSVLSANGAGRAAAPTLLQTALNARVSALPLAANAKDQIIGVQFGEQSSGDSYIMWEGPGATVKNLGGPVVLPSADGDEFANDLEVALTGSINDAGQAVFGVMGYHTIPKVRDLKLYLPKPVEQNSLFKDFPSPQPFRTIPAGLQSLSTAGRTGPPAYVEVAGINNRGEMAVSVMVGKTLNLLGSGTLRRLHEAYDEKLLLIASPGGDNALYRPRAINDRGQVLTAGWSTGADPWLIPVTLFSPALDGVAYAQVENTTTGRQLELSINITNVGGVPISGVTATNFITDGGTGISAKPILTEVPVKDLAPGESLRVRWRYAFRNTGGVVMTWRMLGMHAASSTLVNSSLKNHRFEVTGAPRLDLSLTAVPSKVKLNEPIEVRFEVVNHSADPVTALTLDGSATLTGTGGAELLSGPQPGVVPSLAVGAAAYFTNVYRATNSGLVVFSARAEGKLGANAVLSSTASSGEVTISATGDLAIRRKSTKNSSFKGEGVYEEIPSFAQRKINGADKGEKSVFEIEVVNRSPEPMLYTLGVIEKTKPGWQLQYQLGSQDVTSQVQSPAGLSLPELAPNAALILEATMTPGEVPPPDEAEARFVLRAANDPAQILDSVEGLTRYDLLTAEVTFHRVGPSAATPASLEAGKSSINAPIDLVSDVDVLSSQMPIGEGQQRSGSYYGLVADGVSPLLVKVHVSSGYLTSFPEGRKFNVKVDLVAGGVNFDVANGSIRGPQLADTLRVLDPATGAWSDKLEFVLTEDKSTAFLWFAPIASADLLLENDAALVRPAQLMGHIGIILDSNKRETQDHGFFAIRKPPLFLLHGYNTEGDWGIPFKNLSGRQWSLSANSTDAFIRTIKYGQPPVGKKASGGTAFYPNTLASLEQCAVMAYDEMNKQIQVLFTNWMFTRIDVVGHSQGGVLARMLSSQNPNASVANPFRNVNNFFRGRFHRVVTLGAPHNGSRLLYYILRLNEARQKRRAGNLPTALHALQPLLQEKFNPFGRQIRELNSLDPSGPWFPDAAAPFHLVQATIDEGRSPTTGDKTPVYRMLSLAQAGGGAAVVPRGSDGVVDFDSMGINAPNVFHLASRDVAHSGPVTLFGTLDQEVDSSVLARHVVAALDQDPSASPGSSIEFGPFPVPPLLPDAEKLKIDDWAQKVAAALETASAATIVPQNPTSRPGATFALSTSHFYRVANQPGHLPFGDVDWLVEVYGPNGISSEGVALSPSGPNNGQVTVTVNDALAGDVVLQAFYIDTAGVVVITPPLVVESRPFPGTPLTGLELLPGDSTWPAGSFAEPELVALYGDAGYRRYLMPNQVTVTSSAPEIVSVADPLRWEFLKTGQSQVVLTWSGLTATNQISVASAREPPTSSPALSIRRSQAGAFELSWPASASEFTLETAVNLGSSAGWQPVSQLPTRFGAELSVTIPQDPAVRFFRLRKAAVTTP